MIGVKPECRHRPSYSQPPSWSPVLDVKLPGSLEKEQSWASWGPTAAGEADPARRGLKGRLVPRQGPALSPGMD